MASGDLIDVLYPDSSEPPSTNYATRDTRNGQPCLDFNDTTQQTAIWTTKLLSSAGITVAPEWRATSAVTGTIGWTVEIERGNTDIDADSFAGAQTITAATVDATCGIATTTSVAITSGANMDGAGAGDTIRLRIKRDVANDTAVGDAELISVTVTET